MNEHRYTIKTERTDEKIGHLCSMSYQKMRPEELKSLDELHLLYKEIITIHEGILEKNKKVITLETKIGVDFRIK